MKRSPTFPTRWEVSREVFGAGSVEGVRPRATAMTLVLPKNNLLARVVTQCMFFERGGLGLRTCCHSVGSAHP